MRFPEIIERAKVYRLVSKGGEVNLGDVIERQNKALEACIKAYKTGRHEPMVTAIEAAENTLHDIQQ